MEQKDLAAYAVRITQALKEVKGSAEDVIQYILKEIPELSVQDIIDYLTGVADRLGLLYTDVKEIISNIQKLTSEIKDNLGWNTFWQSLAQGILYVAQLLKNILPKWATIIISIVTAYAELKGGV